MCVFVCLFVCPDSNCNTMKAFIVEINFDIVVSYKLSIRLMVTAQKLLWVTRDREAVE